MVYLTCVSCGATIELSEEELDHLTEEDLDNLVCVDCEQEGFDVPGHIEIIEEEEEEVEESEEDLNNLAVYLAAA
mgnify:CR=1 FL=1